MSNTEPTKTDTDVTPKVTFKEEQLTTREHMDADKHWIGESLPAPSDSEVKSLGAVNSAGVSPYPARADHVHTGAGPSSISDDMLVNDKVNVAGDTMTGNLFAPAVYLTGGQPGGINALTRKDYVDGRDNALINDYTNTRVSRAGDSMTGSLAISSSTDQGFSVESTSGNPYISWWYGSRSGYIQYSSTQGAMNIATDHNWNIRLMPGNVPTWTVSSGSRAWTQNDPFGGAGSGAGFSYSGEIGGACHAPGWNLQLFKAGEAFGHGQLYIGFCGQLTSYLVGSVTVNGDSGVSYNTTSHGPWKGNIQDLNDDEAIERVQKWRPVSFQWRRDEDGDFSENGEPTGKEQHGFIAQELHKVQPNAVLVGKGTEEERREWKTKLEAEEIDPTKEPCPFVPWQADNSKLVPDLVAAVQALTRKVFLLEKKVEALSGAN